MNARWIACLLALIAAPALAQGFGGLGTTAEGFAVPKRGEKLVFPRDHGQHPDHRIEWWYVTANLVGPDGTAYGAQWTLFRSALSPEVGSGWSSPQLYMAHAAVTTKDRQFVAERRARGGTGQADVTLAPFTAAIDDWTLTSRASAGQDEYAALTATARGEDFAFELALDARGPLVEHGERGYSVKSQSGQASYYYSQPFYQVSGTLDLPSGEVVVTGNAWLDREWSSQPLADNQTGWDWLSLHFEGGAKLMGFQLRQHGGDAFTSATWIDPDGTPQAMQPGDLVLKPLDISQVGERMVPTQWRVLLPKKGVDVTIDALNPQAWMATSVPYWEGPVTVKGSSSGVGYLEMTGY
ncbi:iron ABC transporter permease [Rhizobiaceae bacterium]|nr:iron ABC transporter permease [Rhizobiaceae bacterium]